MQQCNREQILEWAESPVTLTLLEIVKQEVTEFEEAKKDAFAPFDPQRTQEILAGINGAQDSWEMIAPLLQADEAAWDHYLKTEEEDEESGEPERD